MRCNLLMPILHVNESSLNLLRQKRSVLLTYLHSLKHYLSMKQDAQEEKGSASRVFVTHLP